MHLDHFKVYFSLYCIFPPEGPPRILYPSRTVQFGKRGRQGFIKLYIYSIPEIKEVQVKRNGSTVKDMFTTLQSNISVFVPQSEKQFKYRGLMLTFRIYNVTEKDFGSYCFNISNGHGFDQFTVNFKKTLYKEIHCKFYYVFSYCQFRVVYQTNIYERHKS